MCWWVERIIITACGTSWHSALIGEYMLEEMARIPVEVEYASEPARRLLREFAPDGVLVDWLASASRRPLVHHRGERRLIVERVGDALLLEEPPPELGLTAREREVLTWVARGKTNTEVAQLLWLAPSTVSKHLENVYAKLGVESRTAAIAHALEHRIVRTGSTG